MCLVIKYNTLLVFQACENTEEIPLSIANLICLDDIVTVRTLFVDAFLLNLKFVSPHSYYLFDFVGYVIICDHL